MSSIRRSLSVVSPLLGAGVFLLASGPMSAQTCGADTLATNLDAGLSGPLLRTPDGSPVLGRSFSLRVHRGAAGASGTVLLGLNETPVFLPRFGVTVFPAAPFLSAPFVLDAVGASPQLVQVPPLDPALCGRTGTAQAVVFDASAQAGAAFSNGVRLRIGVVTNESLPGLGYRFNDPVDLTTVGDMDNDGILDVIVADSGGGRIGVGLGRGDGSFATSLYGITSIGAVEGAVGDFNGNGNLDVALTNPAFTDNLMVFLGGGNGRLGNERSYGTGNEPGALLSADFDGDGRDDVAVANADSDDVSVLWGFGGTGNFQGPAFFAVGTDPRAITTADFDGNGTLDLAVGARSEVSILLGAGDATFDPAPFIPVASIVAGVAAGDFDGDTLVDLVVSQSLLAPANASRLLTLLGLGDGTFVAGPALDLGPGNVGRPLVADIDGDGRLDVGITGPDRDFLVITGIGNGAFAPPVRYQLSGWLRTPLLADLDVDGRVDLIGTHSTTHYAATYRGLEGGRFPQISRIEGQDYPLALEAADFNGDGIPDLAIPNRYATQVTIQLGDGDGGFVSAGQFVAGDSMRDIAAADLDGDGDEDLAVPNGFGVAVLLGDGDGTFAPRTDYPVPGIISSVATGDLNGDGDADLALTRSTEADVAVLFGTGAGAFGPPVSVPTGVGPIFVELVDLDSDGNLDMATAANIGGTIGIHLGNGDGTFGAPTFLPVTQPNSLDDGDFNLDGIPDLAVAADSPNQVVLFFGQGGGAFGPPVQLASGADLNELRVGDLDGDGADDVIVVDEGGFLNDGGALGLLRGRGDGTFESIRYFAVQSVTGATALTLADFDLDGQLDVATAETGSLTTLFGGTVHVMYNLIGE